MRLPSEFIVIKALSLRAAACIGTMCAVAEVTCLLPCITLTLTSLPEPCHSTLYVPAGSSLPATCVGCFNSRDPLFAANALVGDVCVLTVSYQGITQGSVPHTIQAGETILDLPITLVIYLAQIPLSQWYLRHYRIGPVEWLWRSLSYGEPQRFRR